MIKQDKAIVDRTSFKRLQLLRFKKDVTQKLYTDLHQSGLIQWFCEVCSTKLPSSQMHVIVMPGDDGRNGQPE